MQDAIDTLDILQDMKKLDVDKFDKPFKFFVHPSTWNAYAKRTLKHKDFKGKVILYPVRPVFSTSPLTWIPKGVFHGFADESIDVRVSRANTTIRPLRATPSIPYIWYPHQPDHVVTIKHMSRGFTRLHPATNVCFMGCTFSKPDLDHVMRMTNDVTLINATLPKDAGTYTCHARTLTIDTAALPILKEVKCSLLLIIAPPNFDDRKVDAILVPKYTRVHIIRVGPIPNLC